MYSRHNEEKHLQNASRKNTTKSMVSVSKSVHFEKLDDSSCKIKHIH